MLPTTFAVLSTDENAKLQLVRDAGGLDRAADNLGIPRAAFRREVRQLQRKLASLEAEWANCADVRRGQEAAEESAAERREAGLEHDGSDLSTVCLIGQFSSRNGMETLKEDLALILQQLRAERQAQA